VKKGIVLVFFISSLMSFALYFFSDVVTNLMFHKPNLTPFIKVVSFALIPFSLSLVIAQSFRGLKEIKHFSFFSQPARYIFAIFFFFVFSYFGLIDQVVENRA
jgi:Na+-driven multidrug efflux pump